MNKNCGIYKITSPTGRVYIGQSLNIRKRFIRYACPKGAINQPRLQKSFLKYGVENHQFDIIEYCSEDELNCSERFWQDQFDVLSGGLNCILQTCGELKYRHSEETRQKMSDNSSRRKLTEDQIRELQKYHHGGFKKEKNPNWGKKASLETRQKMSKSKKESLKNKGGKNYKAKLVLCTQSGVFYDCVSDAAKTYSINAGYLQSMLNPNSKDRNKTFLIYA